MPYKVHVHQFFFSSLFLHLLFATHRMLFHFLSKSHYSFQLHTKQSTQIMKKKLLKTYKVNGLTTQCELSYYTQQTII